MSQGFVIVPHGTYEIWKSDTIGNEYDLDGNYGCQCWDYASLFWRNIGFPAGYPLTGNLHYASECWTASRDQNSSYNGSTYFNQINSISSVKKGDVLVFNGTNANPTGHITFADEDYDGSGFIWCVGQNQGGIPLPQGGTAVTRNHLSVNDFLGAFRYISWSNTPPTPEEPINSHFPWVLYSNRIRKR